MISCPMAALINSYTTKWSLLSVGLEVSNHQSSSIVPHKDKEQVVIHRDIKASWVLLDSELNGKLREFVLARLYDHGTDSETTDDVETTGYLAPELARTNKATSATDGFAFGAFLLEVACGRRPVEPSKQGEEQMLIGWVLANWRRGFVLETRDPRFGEEYCCNEVELVLKLGLLCSGQICDKWCSSLREMHPPRVA